MTCAAVPSPELVDRVRDLYQKRVSDVRFLIPVLNGLSKVSFSVLCCTNPFMCSRGACSVHESVVFLQCTSNEMFVCMQKEVVAALPKLIKLNPVVVKEVFNRLLGVQSERYSLFDLHKLYTLCT